MLIESLDLIVVVIWLPKCLIFIALVYVKGRDALALDDIYDRLRKVIIKV